MIRITSRGSFSRTLGHLDRLRNGDIYRDLSSYGERGVAALAAATPIDTGETANSWDYIIERDRKTTKISWINTNTITPGGPSVAILIQFDHGTGTGGFVQGRDYINPAMGAVFDSIANDIWSEIRR